MEVTNDPPHSSASRSSISRLKMHLRYFTVGGFTYRLVTPRPATQIAFSTNFFHQTWHIVTSQRGAQLLGRLLWGLSYQRQAGTLVLLHDGHLLPTPFEGERSDPILLVPDNLTRLNSADLRILKNRLNQLGPPAQTIRWHTFGLDRTLQARQDGCVDRSTVAADSDLLRRKANRLLWRQERMQHLGGFICYSAPPPILRQQALALLALRVRRGSDARNMDYHFLARSSSQASWWGDGEVQIFGDYMERVAAATEARQELLANPRRPVLSETLQEDISRRRDQIKVKREKRHRQSAGVRS
jgi:hypothetical protein